MTVLVILVSIDQDSGRMAAGLEAVTRVLMLYLSTRLPVVGHQPQSRHMVVYPLKSPLHTRIERESMEILSSIHQPTIKVFTSSASMRITGR